MAILEKILYVEDEPDIQAVAKLALEAVGGYTVHVCSSGKQALNDVKTFAPDIILLDVMMPEMDGPSTLKAMLEIESLKQIPIAFMTAKVQEAEIQHYKSLGAIDVIPKPFDPMTLAEQVKLLWEKSQR